MLDLQVAHWRNLGAAATGDDFRVDAETFEVGGTSWCSGCCATTAIRCRRCSAPGAGAQLHRAAFEHVVTTFHIPLAFDMFDRLADLSILSQGRMAG